MICSNCHILTATRYVTGYKLIQFTCDDCLDVVEDDIDINEPYSDLDLTPYDAEFLEAVETCMQSIEQYMENNKPKRGDGVAVVYISRKQLGLSDKDQ